MRLNCLEALRDIYKGMESWSEEESPYRIATFGRHHLVLYGEMHKQQTDELMYKYAPKHHLFDHCLSGSRGNPRLSWCYSDEDTIGKAAKLARASNRTHVGRHLIENV